MFWLRVSVTLVVLAAIGTNGNDDECTGGSIYTRRPCVFGRNIQQRQACLRLNCCYDTGTIGPAYGKCYKKRRTMSFGFTSTAQPAIGAAPGVLNVGGTKDFPGSQITLQCNPLRPCRVNYRHNTRSQCLRQGCCYRNGRCYENDIKILRLREKCEPGYANPPACLPINSCEEGTPCKNGAECKSTGPGIFSCVCTPGYSGKTCEIRDACVLEAPCENGAECQTVGDNEYECTCTKGYSGKKCEKLNCAELEKPKMSLVKYDQKVDEGKYQTGTVATIACVSDHHPYVSADDQKTNSELPEMTRVCKEGEFKPSIADSPIDCREGCAAKKPTITMKYELAAGTSQRNATHFYKHGDELDYSCRAVYASQGVKKVKCQDGDFEEFSLKCSTQVVETCRYSGRANSLDTSKRYINDHKDYTANFVCQWMFATTGDPTVAVINFPSPGSIEWKKGFYSVFVIDGTDAKFPVLLDASGEIELGKLIVDNVYAVEVLFATEGASPGYKGLNIEVYLDQSAIPTPVFGKDHSDCTQWERNCGYDLLLKMQGHKFDMKGKNRQCVWTFEIPSGRSAKITISESSVGKKNDYLRIVEEKSGKSITWDKENLLSGSEVYQVPSEIVSNRIMIIFNSGKSTTSFFKAGIQPF